jgi:hypothetical protein
MAEQYIPCPIHTLVEEIQNGTVMVKPYSGTLADLEAMPHLAEPKPMDLAGIHRDGHLFATSHKFDFSAWPHETTVLSDVLYETGDEMLTSQIAGLPYPNVVFCHRRQMPEGVLDEALLVTEHRSDGPTLLFFRPYQRLVGVCPWYFCGFTTAFRYAPRGTEVRTDWIGDPLHGYDEEARAELVSKYGPDFAHQFVANHVCFFTSVLAALSSKGPEIRTLPAPEKLNKQRAKKGRPPIFEYRIVEIPAWAKAKAEGLGGTHASPRLHWRRGHVRHFRTGCTTLIRPCLVGVAENGFIHKDYAVAPTPAD